MSNFFNPSWLLDYLRKSKEKLTSINLCLLISPPGNNQQLVQCIECLLLALCCTWQDRKCSIKRVDYHPHSQRTCKKFYTHGTRLINIRLYAFRVQKRNEVIEKKDFIEKVELEWDCVWGLPLCLPKSQTISSLRDNLYNIIGLKYGAQSPGWNLLT